MLHGNRISIRFQWMLAFAANRNDFTDSTFLNANAVQIFCIHSNLLLHKIHKRPTKPLHSVSHVSRIVRITRCSKRVLYFFSTTPIRFAVEIFGLVEIGDKIMWRYPAYSFCLPWKLNGPYYRQPRRHIVWTGGKTYSYLYIFFVVVVVFLSFCLCVCLNFVQLQNMVRARTQAKSKTMPKFLTRFFGFCALIFRNYSFHCSLNEHLWNEGKMKWIQEKERKFREWVFTASLEANKFHMEGVCKISPKEQNNNKNDDDDDRKNPWNSCVWTGAGGMVLNGGVENERMKCN